MAEKENIENRDFFDKISVLLNDIENKVAALNDCSTDDFRLLNKYLKQQYSRIESISGNVTAVFEIITGRAGKHLQAQITEFSDMYDTGLKCIDRDITDKNEVLEELISKHKLLYIPLKNLLQNIVTINLLANSLKFNISFRAGSKDNPVAEYIEKLAASIENMKGYNKQFDSLASELSDNFEVVAEKTGFLVEHNSHNLEAINDYLLTAEKRIKEKLLEAKVKLPEIKRIKSQYSQSVNKIIINLQYSDIIRQKISHISTAQRDMLTRINRIKEQESIEAFNPDLLKIKDVADLQTAQLIRTSDEYQNAIKIISEKFVDIRRDTNTLAFDILHFSGRKDLDENENYDFFYILDALGKIQKLVNNFLTENTGLQEYYEKIDSAGQDFEKVFEEYAREYQDSQEVISNILGAAREYSEEVKEVKDVLNQLEGVAQSIESNMNEIFNYKKDIKEYSYEVKSGQQSSNCPDLTKSADLLHELITSTKDYNQKIKHILLETETVEQMVSGDISKALKEVKYYTFYETTGKDIALRMKELYELISIKHQDMKEKEDHLDDHKEHYTMQSERDVHDFITGKSKEEKKSDDEENEVEFF